MAAPTPTAANSDSRFPRQPDTIPASGWLAAISFPRNVRNHQRNADSDEYQEIEYLERILGMLQMASRSFGSKGVAEATRIRTSRRRISPQRALLCQAIIANCRYSATDVLQYRIIHHTVFRKVEFN